MSKLYVFAIGGSGSRVLRSLTMLLSSGVHTDYEIVPMIVIRINQTVIWFALLILCALMKIFIMLLVLTIMKK